MTSADASVPPRRYWVETLGCPKNQVDSDKLVGTLIADGFLAAETPEDAELVVVNTCAFVDTARPESVDTILDLDSNVLEQSGGEQGPQGRRASAYPRSGAGPLSLSNHLRRRHRALPAGIIGLAPGFGKRGQPVVPRFVVEGGCR